SDNWRSGSRPETDENARIIGRRVAPVRTGAPPDLEAILPDDAHAGSELISRRAIANQFQTNPMPLVTDVIDQEPQRTARVADHDVGVAVVVDIAERGAAAHFRHLKHLAGAAADVFEPSRPR